MRYLKIILPLLLLVPFALANAQETLPWPPDPAAIFAPGVEIVESGLVVHPPDLRPTYDNDARVVRVYQEDTGDWREYPYPDEISELTGIDSYSEGVLLLITIRGRGIYGTSPDPTGYWLLNMVTGEFSRPELMCGELHAREGEGEWVILEEGANIAPELCHIGSGERIPLPIDDYLYPNAGVTVSPDGRRAVFFGYPEVYVYTFETGEILHLGNTQAIDFRFAYWLGNEQVLIEDTEMADMSFPWIYYSLGQVTEEKSLDQVTVAYKPGHITMLANPQRYEWVDYHDGKCYLVHVHVENGQRDEYDLQDLCEQGIPLPDTEDRLFSPWRGESLGSYFYHPESRDLVRFNPYTGERRDLMSGEIEFILDISADGRYAVLVLDDNGQLDMLTEDERQYLHREDRPIHFRLAIISLETGDALHEIALDQENSVRGGDFWYTGFSVEGGQIYDAVGNSMSTFPNASLFNIGGNRFIFQRWQAYTSTLIELNDSGVTETPLDRVLLVLSNGDRLIMAANEDNTPGPLNAYNATTGETTTIMPAVSESHNVSQLAVEGYSVWLSRGDTADLMQVNVYNTELEQSWRYVVRIP
jgi:hypothetical protein